jgi:hypothetical protein
MGSKWMATHEEPLPKWLEEELRQRGLGTKLRERELFLQKKDPSEVSKPAYGRGEECPF